MLVDMHSQVVRLPGHRYDNDEETIRILKSAAADGITHMIATPLYQYDSITNNEKTIGNRVNNLNIKLNRLQIPVTVFEGMEIVLYEKIAQDIKLNLLPLAGSNKYVFISFRAQQIPSFAINVFFEMQLMGYIPIIANVEQNVDLLYNYQKVREFVEKGALIHVGAASILGMNGRGTRKKALNLCRKGLVQLVSSSSSESESRPSLLKPAYEYMEKKLSPRSVGYFIRNAESVVNGSDFHIQNPITFRKT
jgi:protein-tyrosine phosphatase